MDKEKFKQVALYRVFNGHKYVQHSRHLTRNDAKREARYLKSNKHNVRIINISKTVANKLDTNLKYIIYIMV